MLTRKFIQEIKRQLQIAPPKVIVTPGISNIVKPTIAALTIIVNNPKVKNISGKDIIFAIGFTIELTSENIKPADK